MDMMTQDAVDGEVMRLSMMAASKDFALARPGADAEALIGAVDPDARVDYSELTPSLVEEAAAELAEQAGLSFEAVMDMARALAAGRSAEELAVGLSAVAADLQRAADGGGMLSLSVSQAERDALAKKGHGYALPGGDYPIPDSHHLALAKGRYHAGDLAGHSRSEVRSHINAAAKRLGEPTLDDDDDQDQYDSEGLSASYSRQLVHTGTGYETVPLSMPAAADYGYVPSWDLSDEVARLTADHGEFFGLAARRGKTYLHSDESTMDHSQPHRGGELHSEVERYLAQASKMFGGEAMHAGKHGSQTYAPKSYARRTAEEARARPGHTNTGPWNEGGIGGARGSRPPGRTLMPSSRY